MICAFCGKEITEEYYKVLDNYLQVKYFDSEDDNVFCSQDCFCESVFLTGFFIEEEGEQE